ncbi:hypothetical protein Tco_1488511, partial [Tanacetum coccineum]
SHLLPSSTPPSGTPPLLPIPLPTLSPPLLLPSTDCRAGVSEVTLPPRKRLCIALGLRFEVSESSSAPTSRLTRGFRVDYGFVATLDDEIRRDPKKEDKDEIYVRLDDAQDDRSLMRGESIEDYFIGIADQDRGVTGNRPQETCTSYGDTDTDEDTADIATPWLISIQLYISLCDKMAPKRTTRSTPATTTTPTTSVINEQLKRLIDQGVADVLAAFDTDRSMNGDDNHNSGRGVRRQAPFARECTYPDFMKCKPIYFKGTEGVIKLT